MSITNKSVSVTKGRGAFSTAFFAGSRFDADALPSGVAA